MEITEKDVKKLVEQVLTNLKASGFSQNDTTSISFENGIFDTVDQAVLAAKEAEKVMNNTSIDTRRKMIQAMREISLKHARELAELAVVETGLGNVESKEAKNILAAEKTPGLEDLVSSSFSGDDGLTLVELAPIGIVGAITPSTNPAATIINNSISLVAAGNVVVFNPHPSAKNVSLKAMQLLNSAITSVGGPPNVLTSVHTPSLQTSQEVMEHPDIRALVVTGGGVVVSLAMKVGKKVVAAGPGNPPVVVDETANIEQAARDIVAGASFDNNVLCTAEKEVFVVDKVAGELKRQMVKNGAYLLNQIQLDKLLKEIMVENNGKLYPNRAYIGKDAKVLLEVIGKKVDSSIKLLIAETKTDHPLVMREMLMPILPIVKVPNVDKAIEQAVIAEKGNRHTAVMHSQNITNLTKMARAIQSTIFVKNGPSYSGLGYGAEGFATLTIAGPTGEGLTSARTFTRERRCVLVDGFNIV